MNLKERYIIQKIKEELVNDDGSSDFCELYCHHPHVLNEADQLENKCRECPIDTVIGLLEMLNLKEVKKNEDK